MVRYPWSASFAGPTGSRAAQYHQDGQHAASGAEAERTYCLGHISARGVALAGRQGDAGHEVEGEGRRESAHEHGVRQQRVGRGVPGHQQVEGEAAQLVDGIVCAQARVRLQTKRLSVLLWTEG